MQSIDTFTRRHIPLVQALSGYGRSDLRGDLTAGLTTAVMLVPQAMAYAMLAGLPPIIGLYASTLPLAVYAILGTSRHLAVGPVAMVSLMVAAGVEQIAAPGSETYLVLAVVLAAMVGLIQLLLGFLRLGFVVNFLSHPVVSGFTSAAALIIGLSQLKHLLGIELTRSHHVHVIVLEAAQRLAEIDPSTLAIGVGSVAALLLIRRLRPTFPGALIVVVAGAALVQVLGLHNRGVAIVGDVPAGLPPFALPTFDTAALRQLLPTAVAISLVGFMESISVAKAMASRHHYEVDANRELLALGAANIAGSLFSGYPVTGGFSRTAVNAQAGARSGIASLVTAGLVAFTLLLLTPLFYYVPKAVLAAIIMVAVFGLVDISEVRHLWKVKRSDLALLVITFVATLGINIEAGILLGIGSSIMAVMIRTTRPHTAVLGRVPGSHAYRNIERFKDAQTEPGIIVLRIDAQFYFGNVNFLKETIGRLEARASGEVRAIVINAASINQLDSSADRALHEIARDLAARGVQLYFAEVRGPVLDVMQRSGFVQQLGEDRFLLTVHRAVERARKRKDATLQEAVQSASPSSSSTLSPSQASPATVGSSSSPSDGDRTKASLGDGAAHQGA